MTSGSAWDDLRQQMPRTLMMTIPWAIRRSIAVEGSISLEWTDFVFAMAHCNRAFLAPPEILLWIHFFILSMHSLTNTFCGTRLRNGYCDSMANWIDSETSSGNVHFTSASLILHTQAAWIPLTRPLNSNSEIHDPLIWLCWKFLRHGVMVWTQAARTCRS